MRRALAACLAAAAAVVTFSPAPVWALTCSDQNLTLGWPKKIVVGIDDEWGDDVYASFRQGGDGRRCTNGSDIGNSTVIRLSGPGSIVKGAWINPNPVWGKNAGSTYIRNGGSLTVNLKGKRLGAGQGDRTGGASVVVDRWRGSNIAGTIRGRTQQ